MSSHEQDAAPFDPFAGPAIALGCPTTESQREVWAAAQMSREASLAYTEAVMLALRGRLDVHALRAAITALCARHESLRATFTPDGLTMLVGEPAQVMLPLVDLTALDDAARHLRRTRLLDDAVREPFDLERGPLVRFMILRHEAQHHEVLIAAHHIICDGWSFGVIASDLATLYDAQLHGAAAPPPAARFTQYAARACTAARSSVRAVDERHWLDQFSGTLPVLDLPSDRVRPARRTFEAGREDLLIPAPLAGAVRAAGARTGSSLFVTLLGGFATLLHRLTGQDDLVIGVPSAGQAASGDEGLVGHCVNTLPVRVQVPPDARVSAMLNALRASTLDAAEHQQLGLGSLLARLPVARDPSRPPLVAVIFNLDRALPASAISFSGIVASMTTVPRAYENFELFVNAVETQAGIVLECQYSAALFDAATVRRWLASYVVLLQGMAKSTDTDVGALPLLTDADHEALARCNQTALEVPFDACVHDLIAAQMLRTPGAVAVQQDGAVVTYADLDTRANRLAHHLRSLGAARGTLVGLCLDRTPDLLVGLLAILRSGAGYVPLDPSYPVDRLAFMARDAALAVLLTDAHQATALALPAAAVVRIDADAAAIAACPSTPLPIGIASARPDDIAYVIYTSGSTGRPKGVLVPHCAVVNLLCSVQREPGLSAEDVVLAITTLSFDIAVSEVLLPLTVGARIVLASRETASDGAQLAALIADSGVTFIDATPATYRMLLASGWRGGPTVRLICTGEAMPRDLAQQLVACVRDVWNGYGPTETTVWSTFARITSPVERILIGRPIANTRIRVVDARRQQVPVGVAGELLIGGRGVTSGYLHRSDLTAERFIDDPASPGARCYRTGDLVRLLPTGELECLGRNDHQVKVRGFRIEPGEIETVLARFPGVQAAAVIAREDRVADVRLVAYVVLQGGGALPEALRTFARRALPDYMVPNLFVGLDALPLTPSGKVDRKALPAPHAGAAAAVMAPFVEARTTSERTVATLWAEALGVQRISIHDDFFALGGHSLLASQVLARLRRDHGVQLCFRRIFEAPTVQAFAALIDAEQAANVGGPPAPVLEPIVAQPAANRGPLSVLQERLWMLEELQPAQASAHAHSASWLLEGDLDVERLERAIRQVIERHATLRTRFEIVDGERWQVIEPTTSFVLARLDLSSHAEAAQRQALHEFFRSQQLTPFELATAPLLRAVLICLGAGQHLLYTLQHGMIWDGWSFDLFLHDLNAFYSNAGASLALLPVTYRDFAAWQATWLASDDAARQRAFWERQLSGELAELVLPTDRPRDRSSTLAGDLATLAFTPDEVEQLRAFAKARDSTLFMVTFAAWNVVLHRYSGIEDLLVGSPVRARTRPELERIIGPFVNTVLLRTMVVPSLRFSDLLTAVRETTLDAFSHQELPFERLGVRVPPLRVFFSMQDARERPTALGAVTVAQQHVPQFSATNDMMLWMMESRHGMLAVLNFDTGLFGRASADLMLTQLRTLLLAAMAHPDATIGSFDLREPGTASQAAPLRAPGAAGAVPVHHAVAQRASEVPDRIAIRAGRVSLTYADVDAGARRVAAAIAGQPGTTPHTVAIMLPPGADRVVAALGALRAGAAITFLDPADAAVHRQRVISACGATLVIADAPAAFGVLCLVYAEMPPSGNAPAINVAPAEPALVVTAPGAGGTVVWQVISGELLAIQLRELTNQLALDGADVVLTVQDVAVPSALLEWLLPLASGGTLVIASDDARDDSRDLADELVHVGATLLVAAEEVWRGLLATSWQASERFTAVVTMGARPVSLAHALVVRVPRVFTLVGTVCDGGASAVHRVSDDDAGFYAGTPLTPWPRAVCDPDGRIEATGIPGQLVVETATARVLLAARARVTSDGRVQLLEDDDTWIWLDGAPVQPAALVDALQAHVAVRHAAVTVHRDATGARRLVAYIVTEDGARVGDAELRTTIRKTLPDRCVPQRFISLDAASLAPGGTIEPGHLVSPFAIADQAPLRVAPRTPAESVLADAWKEALGVGDVGPGDNFFQLGGTSLLCFQVVERVRRTSGQHISPRVMLVGTLESAAASMTSPSAGPTDATVATASGMMSRLKGLVSGAAV